MNLSKISLKKSGESHKIDLTKNRRRIHVNLNWDQRRGLFSRGIDLDLACMYRLKDGRQGGHPGPGQQLRCRRSAPPIKLDKDDRSGASANGENMDFFRPELIDFAVVFAFIYEGVPNWRSTNARVVLSQQGGRILRSRSTTPTATNGSASWPASPAGTAGWRSGGRTCFSTATGLWTPITTSASAGWRATK